MINYDEMQKVIGDLNEYVEKMEAISETQKKLDCIVGEIGALKTSISEIEKTCGDYTSTITAILSTHNALETQVERVAEDYKKLHSSFELIEIELKKFDAKIETSSAAIQSRVESMNECIMKMASEIDEQFKIIENLVRKVEMNEVKNRRISLTFSIISIVFLTVILVIAIVTLLCR